MTNVRVETEGQMPTGKQLYQTLIDLYADQLGIKIHAEISYNPPDTRALAEEAG